MKAPSGNIITEILRNEDAAKQLMFEVIVGDKSHKGETVSIHDNSNNRYTIQKIGFYTPTSKS